MALAKNSLQYLSLSDYLSREYELTRRESYYAVREDLAAAVLKMRARLDLAGATVFTGVSRMAVPLTSFSLTAVRRAGVGETVPREVAGEVVFSVRGLKGERREGWESVREHSILFLVHVVARNRDEHEYSFGQELRKEVPISVGDIDRVDFLEKEGILVIRGCEVVSMEDEEGVTLNDASSPDIREKRAGKKRRLKVRLDPAQYQRDMARVAKGEIEDPYASFNLLVRRDPACNTFKAVLATARELQVPAERQRPMPGWLERVLLGLGDPAAAQYARVAPERTTIDFSDTFVDARHVVEAFPQYVVTFRSKSGEELSEADGEASVPCHFPVAR